MHDPMTVAFEVKVPIPRRDRWAERRADRPRWAVVVARRTNDANRGERVYPAWRPKGYQIWVAGRTWRWRDGWTVWHVEPGGRDSGAVCRHGDYADEMSAVRLAWARLRGHRPSGTDDLTGDPIRPYVFHREWVWHVRHWSLQWHLGRTARRFLRERCAGCGYRFPWGYSPVSHSWDAPPRPRWPRKYAYAYHHECSAVVSQARDLAARDDALRAAVAAYRTAADLDELDAIEALGRAAQAAYDETRPPLLPDGTRDYGRDTNVDFRTTQLLLRVCGYRYEDEHKLRWDGRLGDPDIVSFHGSYYRRPGPDASVPDGVA